MLTNSQICKYYPALIVVVGYVSYSNTFGNSFHFDDFFNIVNNTSIRNLSNLNEIFKFNPNRFVGYLSFALNYKFWGLSLWWLHLVNISIHIINAVLIYNLLQLLFETPKMAGLPIKSYKLEISLITALIFVSHPLATESITYIIQRLNSLMFLWYIISIICYIKARLSTHNTYTKNLYSFSIIAAFLAFFSKENSFSLPFIIISIEWLFFHEKSKNNPKKRNWLFIVLLLSITIVSVYLLLKSGNYFKTIPPREGHSFSITIYNYWLSQIVVIIKYASLILLPMNQVFDYGMPPISNIFTIEFIVSLVLILLSVLAILKLHRKYPLFTFGLLLFFITVAPQSIVPRPNLIFEYRVYPGIAGIIFASIALYYHLILRTGSNKMLVKYRWVIPGILVASLIVLTFQRNEIWRNEKTLWTDTLEKKPNNARAWVNLGIAFADENNFNKALLCYNNAIGLWPEYIQAYNNRGVIYATTNKYEEALSDFQKAIDLQNRFQPAWINKIKILSILGENSKANETMEQAIKKWPDNNELIKLYESSKEE